MGEIDSLILSGDELVEICKKKSIIPLSISADIALGGGIPLGCTTVVAGKPGLGKAQPIDRNVLTPTGWQHIGNLKIGDKVCGSDGNFYNVTGVFPQGKMRSYRVVFDDGSYTKCTNEHLWFTSSRKERINGVPGSVKTLSEIRQNLKVKSGENTKNNHQIPFVQPVRFNHNLTLPLDPYVLGCFLGDGRNALEDNVSFYNIDLSIIKEVSSRLDSRDQINSIDHIKHSVIRKNRNNQISHTKETLNSLGLFDTSSFNKFIPYIYKFASVDDRVSLLQGLFDTDGYVVKYKSKKIGSSIEYVTVSLQLAKDVKFIVQSLGGRCTMKIKRDNHYLLNGQRINASTCYRLYITFNHNLFIPFKGQKKNQYKHVKTPKQRTIKDIKISNKCECICISVDSPDKLYITDDFILTHNTTIALQCAANAQKLFNTEVFFFPVEGRLTSHIFEQVRDLKTGPEHLKIVMPPKRKKGIGHEVWYAEDWWAKIGETILENPGSIIIVDSIASFSSEKEQSENMGYQSRGREKQLEAQFCRKYAPIINANEVTIFFLTQVQANTSGYGNPFDGKVGNAIRHQADVMLFGKAALKWKETDGKILGHDMVFRVEKSALGMPNLDITIPLRYGVGVDNEKDIVSQAINWGLIQKAGAWYSLPFKGKDTKLTTKDNDIKVQGEENIRNWLLENPEHYKVLESHIRELVSS